MILSVLILEDGEFEASLKKELSISDIDYNELLDRIEEVISEFDEESSIVIDDEIDDEFIDDEIIDEDEIIDDEDKIVDINPDIEEEDQILTGEIYITKYEGIPVNMLVGSKNQLMVKDLELDETTKFTFNNTRYTFPVSDGTIELEIEIDDDKKILQFELVDIEDEEFLYSVVIDKNILKD